MCPSLAINWHSTIEVMKQFESLGNRLNQLLSDVLRLNYELIAKSDIENPLQDIVILDDIAMRDVAAIGEVVDFRIL